MRPLSRYSRAALVVLMSLAATAAVSADTIERSFPATAGGTLILDTDRGAIDVRATGGDQVHVTVTREGSEDRIADFTVDFATTSNGLEITGDDKRKSNWGGSRNLRVRFDIEVPESYNLDLETSGGSISVDGLRGEVAARTSGGSMTFGRIDGPVRAKTSGGNIELKGSTVTADVSTSGGNISIGEVNGTVAAHTSGGSIRIQHAGGAVNASTSGGNIYVDEVRGSIDARTSGGSVKARITEQPQAACRLSTSGGRVELEIAESIAASINAQTSGGRISVDFPVTVSGEISRSRLQTDLNGGGPEITLRSSGGGISVSRP